MKRIVVTLACIFASIGGAQEHSTKQHHWQQTESETLWVGRYSNCQYGYYVLLSAGVIAHAELPPSPHHGFLLSLPDAGSKAEISVYNSDRFIWVNAEFNASDNSTLAGIADSRINLSSRDRQDFRLIERHKAATLRSVPATRFKGEYGAPKGRIIEEEVVALRSGIVYEIGLRTPEEDYPADRERLEEILTAFRFSRVPEGQCWNY